MTEPNRIRQAVATTVFASVLALGAYQGRILPDAEQLTETVHMTCVLFFSCVKTLTSPQPLRYAAFAEKYAAPDISSLPAMTSTFP